VEIGHERAYDDGIMCRLSATAALLLAVNAASAGAATYFNGPMPLFGGPTTATIGGYTAAPVPNPDIRPPRIHPPTPGEPQLDGSLNAPAPQLRSGAGYSPGSNFNDDLLRRNRAGLTSGLAPSFGLAVPLDK
jgi:hypothetical protein